MPMTFDLDTIPLAEREPALRELLQQNPVPIDVSSGGPDKLHVSTAADFFGQLFMVSCNGHGALVHRGERRTTEDHQRMMMLSVVTSGSSVFRHNDTITDAGLGDIVPYSSTLPYSATFGGVSKHTFMVDWNALELPDHTLDAQLGQSFNRGHVLGHIVSRYLTDLGSNAVYLPDEQRQALEQPTLDMLRALFAVTAGDDARARDPLGATLDIRLLHYIKMHVRDHDLTIERIARDHGISERYAYLILARQGIALGDWIRTQRLEGAARDLTEGTPPAPSISELARTWGFADQGSFTRAFRRHYGQSPTEYRKSFTSDTSD
jgi:AraC-like DNA-binding protein